MTTKIRSDESDRGPEECGDHLVQSLARMAEAGGSVSVTLTLGGAIVTGHTCPAKEYFSHFGESAGHHEFLEQALAEEAARNDSPPRFLHLREARMLSSSTQFPHRGWGYIRCRIGSIDTCMPGHLFEGGHG